MNLLYQRLTSVLEGVKLILRIIAGTGILIGTIMVVVFTGMRYFFHTGVGWSEEAIRMIILFGIYAMNGSVTSSGGMVRLSILVDTIKNKVILKLIDIFNMGVCLVVAAGMSFWSTTVFAKSAGQLTVSTFFPKQLQLLALPVGSYLLLLTVAIKLILLFIELYRELKKNGTTPETEGGIA